MKKIIIKIDFKKNEVRISNKKELCMYKYYALMLIGLKFHSNNVMINLLEMVEKDLLLYAIKLDTISLLILKRNQSEALVLLRKSNKNKYFVASKVFNKYITNFGYIIIKEKESKPISRYDDIMVYAQKIYLKIKFNEFNDIYESYSQDIYKIKRIIYWKNYTFVL